jgi:glycosyltransferase involved in cell wall biosynthesis
MPPLVSVLIPTYNRPDYLRQALESAVRQSYENIEILVGDNSASSQMAEDVVRSFNDPRIRYISHGRNVGMVLNNISLIRESVGKYIAILHDDDIWYPQFLEKTIPALESDSRVSLSFCNFDVIDDSGYKNNFITDIELMRLNRENLEQGIHKNSIEIALVRRSVFACMATVIRRSPINLDHFLTNTDNAYDVWLSYLALIDGGYVHFLSESLGGYRMHTNSSTNTRSLHSNLSLAYCYKNLLDDKRLAKYFSYFRMEITAHSIRSLILIFQQNAFGSAKKLSGNIFFISILQILLSGLASLFPQYILQVNEHSNAVWDFAWKIRNYWQYRLRLLKFMVRGGKDQAEIDQKDVFTPRWVTGKIKK